MYYLLEVDDKEPEPYRTRKIGWNKALSDSDFIVGNYIGTTFEKPFEFELWEYEEDGNGHAEYYYDTFPIMNDALINALVSAGVDNLQLFPAILRDLKNGIERTDYKVVNVVGKIKAADMEKSDYIDMGGTGVIAVGFKKLSIDEGKTHGALLFRLVESITDIVIHESVKEYLQKCEFKYLRYLPCK